MNIKNVKITLLTAMSLLLSVTSINSWAESKSKYDIAYDACVKKAGTINNSVVHECSEIVSSDVKTDMNKLYDTIHEKISEHSADDAKKLEESQQAWLKYRKSHCELMGSYVGSPMYSFCPMELNKLRALELAELAEE